MYLRLINICRRSFHRTPVKFEVRSTGANKEVQQGNNPDKTVSKLYPTYKIIFSFPYVQHFSLINLIKRNATVISGIFLLGSSILYLLDIISINVYGGVFVSVLPLTGMLHLCALMMNNTVGYIYYKPDEEKIKISYISYWGKRREADANLEEISLFDDTRTPYMDKFFNSFRIPSHNKQFKVYTRHGDITDKKMFSQIFGY